MTLKEHLFKLKKLIESDPSLLEARIIYANDHRQQRNLGNRSSEYSFHFANIKPTKEG